MFVICHVAAALAYCVGYALLCWFAIGKEVSVFAPYLVLFVGAFLHLAIFLIERRHTSGNAAEPRAAEDGDPAGRQDK